MSFRFNHQTNERLCEQCRKPIGARQFDCPRRQLAGEENCAYQVAVHRIAKSGVLMLILGAVLIGLGVGLPAGIDRHPTALLVGRILLAVSGLGLVFTGSCRQWGAVQSGRNPVTGQTWERTTLFGIEFDWDWQSGFQPVPWSGSPARVIRYPASVMEFYRQGNAADIVSTALLQLFAQKILSLGKQRTQRRLRRSQVRYLVLTGEAFDIGEPLGALETRMVQIVSASELKGLPLSDFLKALFEGGQPQPRNYLIDSYIGPEAIALELGKVVGVQRRTLAPAPNTIARVGRDIQSVEQLYRDLWTTAPEEATELLYQIDRQI
ncbi:MAG: hypothetical protein ACK2T7_03170, partial [Anaerolineales bacterium]